MGAGEASSRPSYLRILVELSIVALVLGIVVAVSLLQEARRPLDSKDLKIAAADLNSLAAEGALLAGQPSDSFPLKNYFRVHSRSWHQKVETANEALRGSQPAEDQRQAYEQTAMLAKDLAAVAAQVASASPDADDRAASLSKLRMLEAQASALRSSLTNGTGAQ